MIIILHRKTVFRTCYYNMYYENSRNFFIGCSNRRYSDTKVIYLYLSIGYFRRVSGNQIVRQ